jgi:tRNA threonylcarbamoyl adenosine modification protein (Sua5/YciO/YrdC/YwlC family)
MLLEINPDNPEPRKIRRAVDAMEAGSIIGYPTDTAYGLGCDLFNKRALDRLYQLKQAQRSRPFAFLCKDLTEVSRFVVMHDHIFRTLRAHLPGPYTFIVDATREVPRVVQSPRKTVGIRVPAHPVARALITELGRPILTSTACRTGETPFVDPRDVDDTFSGLALVIDAGPGGLVPSTVVDLTGERPRIVREGLGDVAPFL